VGTSIVRANSLAKPQSLFLDEGMAGRYSCDPSELVVHAGCDSKHRLGIQLADYVAYHCAVLLKTRLTGVVKNHKMDDTPHPLAGDEVPLDWLVRTEMRRQFFHEPRDFERIEGNDWFFKVSGYGFFSSPDLSTEVKDGAQATFDEMYLGCVW